MLKFHIVIIFIMMSSFVSAQELINSQQEFQPELPIESSNDMPIMAADDGRTAEENDAEDLSGAEQRWLWGRRGYSGWDGGWGGRGYGGGWRLGSGYGRRGILGWGGHGWGYGRGWGSLKRYWG